MLNLTVKLQRSEVPELARIINTLFIQHADDIEYADYFNLRSLSKKLLDKQHRLQERVGGKPVTFTINVNEYNSLKHLKEMSKAELSTDAFTYYFILLNEITDTLHRQISNVYRPGLLML